MNSKGTYIVEGGQLQELPVTVSTTLWMVGRLCKKWLQSEEATTTIIDELESDDPNARIYRIFITPRGEQ